MTNHPATITYNNGGPQFNPPPGIVNLDENDTVTVSLSGFPSGATISTVQFYGNTTVNGNDAKNTADNFGNWTRASGNSSGLTGIYSCSSTSNTSVVIQNTEDSTSDDKHWYAIEGTIPNGSWSVDPELINKGKPTADVYVEPQAQERVES